MGGGGSRHLRPRASERGESQAFPPRPCRWLALSAGEQRNHRSHLGASRPGQPPLPPREGLSAAPLGPYNPRPGAVPEEAPVPGCALSRVVVGSWKTDGRVFLSGFFFISLSLKRKRAQPACPPRPSRDCRPCGYHGEAPLTRERAVKRICCPALPQAAQWEPSCGAGLPIGAEGADPRRA